MLETVIVSIITSVVVSKIMAVCYLKKIDKYTDDLLKMLKEFLADIAEFVGNRS